MIIRIRYKEHGGHVHCRVFTAPTSDTTFAKCGDLVFSTAEWAQVQITLSRCHFIEEDDDRGMAASLP